METVLMKFLPYAFIVALAYGLKRIGLFGPTDYRVMVKVVLNVTLPAAVLVSFANSEPNNAMLVMTLIGIALNVVVLVLGLLLGLRRPKPTRALYALALPGYNIGAFGLPIVSSFLGPVGVTYSCFLDVGNAIMCTGGTYALTDSLVNPGKSQENFLLALVKKLSGSTPFLSYTLMLVLTVAGIRIPKGLADFVQPIANANPYCAMFMLGLMFEVNLKREELKAVGTVVLVRNLAAACLAVLCYFLLPLPLVARQAVAVLVFAPPSVLVPTFTERCGGSAAVASCASSLCIVTGLICMTAVLTLLHIY